MNPLDLYIPINHPPPQTFPSRTTPPFFSITHHQPYSNPSDNCSPPPFSLDPPPAKRHCSSPYTTNINSSRYEDQSPRFSISALLTENHPSTLMTSTVSQNVIPHLPHRDDLQTDVEVPTTPQDPSISKNVQHLTPPSSPPAPTIAPMAEKLTKSRAVGQSHRDNEKEYERQLKVNVERAKDENALLFSMFRCEFQRRRITQPWKLSEIAFPWDVPEDHDVHDDQMADSRGLHRVSPETERRLGIRYISPTMASILMDFIILRRNWISEDVSATLAASHDKYEYNTNTNPRKRRRTNHLAVPILATVESFASRCADIFAGEIEGIDDTNHIDFRFGNLSFLLHKWAESEREHGAPDFDDGSLGLEDVTAPPKSPTRPSAADFGSPPQRRRGEGVKTCSRCGVRKFSGSGHGRSTCADGLSISSAIPFPYLKGSDDNANVG